MLPRDNYDLSLSLHIYFYIHTCVCMYTYKHKHINKYSTYVYIYIYIYMDRGKQLLVGLIGQCGLLTRSLDTRTYCLATFGSLRLGYRSV